MEKIRGPFLCLSDRQMVQAGKFVWNGKTFTQVDAPMVRPNISFYETEDDELTEIFSRFPVRAPANINIRRNDVMRALNSMLKKYTTKSAEQLRGEFEEALDEVVRGYSGERELNSMTKRRKKHDRQ
jgi:hypothetical protein